MPTFLFAILVIFKFRFDYIFLRILNKTPFIFWYEDFFKTTEK